MEQTSRSPHGECGLKSDAAAFVALGRVVAPRMGSVD